MAHYAWSVEPMDVISAFEKRHAQPDSGALLAWAVLSVDSVDYLADIDKEFEARPEIAGDHSPDIADVAHARWATGTCITSLDLCAAALRRTFCGHTPTRELALPDFDPSKSPKAASALSAKLPASARDWIKDVLGDPRYKKIKTAKALLHCSWRTAAAPSN